MTNADRYEEAEEFYQKFKADFESKNIEDEEVIGEMIYAAAEYFTYIRYKKKDYIKSIELTENFFSNNKYFDLNEDVSKINYWFNLAWSYHGLKSREQAKKVF
jgi:tetratricopeptide (TPR) repeat protein